MTNTLWATGNRKDRFGERLELKAVPGTTLDSDGTLYTFEYKQNRKCQEIIGYNVVVSSAKLRGFRDKLNELFPVRQQPRVLPVINEIAELDAHNKELVGEVVELKKQLGEAADYSQRQVDAIAELFKENKELQALNVKYREESVHQHERLEKCVAQRSEVVAKNKQSLGNIKALEKQCSIWTADNERLRKQLDDADRHCSRTEERCSQLFEQVEDSQKELKEQKENYELFYTEQADKIEQMQKKNIELHQELKKLQLANKNLLSLSSGADKKLVAENAQLKKEHVLAQSANVLLQGRTKELRAADTELKTKYAEVDRQNRWLTTRREELTSSIELPDIEFKSTLAKQVLHQLSARINSKRIGLKKGVLSIKDFSAFFKMRIEALDLATKIEIAVTGKKEEILSSQLDAAMKEEERVQIERDALEFRRKAETTAAKLDL